MVEPAYWFLGQLDGSWVAHILVGRLTPHKKSSFCGLDPDHGWIRVWEVELQEAAPGNVCASCWGAVQGLRPKRIR